MNISYESHNTADERRQAVAHRQQRYVLENRMSELTAKGLGIPIYLDSKDRDIVDPAEEADSPINWRPCNQLAVKLWRCLEALRDIQEILEDARQVSSPKKQRRRLKILATPILSLAEGVRSLCNRLATDPEIAKRLSRERRDYFNRIREAFDKDVPLGAASPLKSLRNKISAHVDAKLGPKDARELLDGAKPKVYGRWLHACIFVLQELVLPDLYSWHSADGPEGSIRVMNVEPWIVTFVNNEEGELSFAGADIGVSPKRVILRVCEDIVRGSQWLFGADEDRLKVLEDESGNAT
jgi:hypothetical protein